MAGRKSCQGCIYFRAIGVSNMHFACHYMHDTGESRGCPPEKCDKKKTAEKNNYG